MTTKTYVCRHGLSILVHYKRIYKSELYEDFISEHPDFAPKSKFTISRIKFWSWIKSYSIFKYGVEYNEGRSLEGRYIEFIYEDEI